MGYYTDYEVQITGFSNQDEAEFFEFKEFHKEIGAFHDFKSSTTFYTHKNIIEFALNQYKWYNWQNDIQSVSKKYPHLLFEINGVGEEFPDIWKARVCNGETEIVNAEITFPDFKKLVDK